MIVNTHSTSVVSHVDEDDLLVAVPRETRLAGKRHRGVGFAWLHDTWRGRIHPDVRTLSLGQLGAYLNPLAYGIRRRDTAARQRPGRCTTNLFHLLSTWRVMELTYTLLGDGASDEVLLRHSALAYRAAPKTRHFDPSSVGRTECVTIKAPRPRRTDPAAVLMLFPSDLLFVHRDAESLSRRCAATRKPVAAVLLARPAVAARRLRSPGANAGSLAAI